MRRSLPCQVAEEEPLNTVTVSLCRWNGTERNEQGIITKTRWTNEESRRKPSRDALSLNDRLQELMQHQQRSDEIHQDTESMKERSSAPPMLVHLDFNGGVSTRQQLLRWSSLKDPARPRSRTSVAPIKYHSCLQERRRGNNEQEVKALERMRKLLKGDSSCCSKVSCSERPCLTQPELMPERLKKSVSCGN
ncbi:hypothetical protein Q8A73_006200 [Channa argus]|nr:hypothetical protein Q8A73_006200 [Channa argus]